MRFKLHLTFIFVFGIFNHAFGQILHTESFTVIFDTTKSIKGSVLPAFKFQNLKENIFEIENAADLTYRFKKNALTFSNKIEITRFGKEVLLSGGFLYVEYRKIMENKFVIEPYTQIHWSEARGLALKYALGVNARYRIHTTPKLGLFAGIGPFYEYEKWNYKGVRDDMLPLDLSEIVRNNIKIGSYVSFKWKTDVNLDIDLSIYHQSRFDQIFSSPRLASSSSIKYNFTEHLGLVLKYQNIYDVKPVVPIDRLYNKVIFSVEVSF